MTQVWLAFMRPYANTHVQLTLSFLKLFFRAAQVPLVTQGPQARTGLPDPPVALVLLEVQDLLGSEVSLVHQEKKGPQEHEEKGWASLQPWTVLPGDCPEQASTHGMLKLLPLTEVTFSQTGGPGWARSSRHRRRPGEHGAARPARPQRPTWDSRSQGENPSLPSTPTQP